MLGIQMIETPLPKLGEKYTCQCGRLRVLGSGDIDCCMWKDPQGVFGADPPCYLDDEDALGDYNTKRSDRLALLVMFLVFCLAAAVGSFIIWRVG